MVDTRDLSHWKACLSESKARIAARMEAIERRPRSQLLELIRDLEQHVALLERAVQQFETQYRGVPIPIMTWRHVRNDFVLIDCNHAAGEYLSDECLSPETTAGRIYGRRSKTFSRMMDCFHQQTVIEVKGGAGTDPSKRT